jgi:hypothetical protein
MSFCTEDEDTVNSDLAETLREMREQYEAGVFPEQPQSFGLPHGNYPGEQATSNHFSLRETIWDRDMHPRY